MGNLILLDIDTLGKIIIPDIQKQTILLAIDKVTGITSYIEKFATDFEFDNDSDGSFFDQGRWKKINFRLEEVGTVS